MFSARKHILSVAVAIVIASTAAMAEAPDTDRPLWLRYPAVSPDGMQVAFVYAGQIWIVPIEGGEAVAPFATAARHHGLLVPDPDGGAVPLRVVRSQHLPRHRVEQRNAPQQLDERFARFGEPLHLLGRLVSSKLSLTHRPCDGLGQPVRGLKDSKAGLVRSHPISCPPANASTLAPPLGGVNRAAST